MRPFLFILLGVCLLACDTKETRLQQFLLKGNIAARDRNYDQASYYYGEAIRLEPCYADAWNNLGTVYFEQRRFDLALENYTKAIECKPTFVNALINRANAAYETKAYFQSLDDLTKVIAVKPDTALAHFTKGLVYTKMREFDKALLLRHAQTGGKKINIQRSQQLKKIERDKVRLQGTVLPFL